MALYEINPNNMRGSGSFFLARAGEALGRVALVYKHANGAWYLADADAAATMPTLGITMDRATVAGQIVRILDDGFIGRTTWTWTTGGEIYASTVAGALTQVAPGGAGDIVQVVAMATSPRMIKFSSDIGNAGGGGCSLLEGHTAYVGFDNCKGTAHTNYFLVDGVADDVQIALAITFALAAGGGTIFLEEGAYDITATITFAGGDLQIIGDGREATILNLGFEGNLMQIATQDNFTIRDLSMDGNKATYNTDVWSGGLFQTVDNLLVENCDFYEFEGKGIFAREVTDSVFSNCRFYSNDQDGLYLESISLGNPSERVNVNACFAYSNGRKGFNCGEIIDVKFVGCMAYSNTEDGWNLEGSADDSYRLQNVDLVGCKAFSNTQHGVRIQFECSNVILDGCDSYSNTLSGIDLRGDDTFLMTNISISDSRFYLNDDNGINVRFGIEWLKVVNVSVFNNDQAAANNDGVSFGNTTAMQHFIFDDIHAYDDQIAPTQDRGMDFGAGDESGKDFMVKSLRGTGNTNQLFRGTGIIVPEVFIPVSDADGFIGNHPSAVMPDAADTSIYAQISLPLEFQQLVTAQVIVVAVASGNLRRSVNTDFGELCNSEDYNTHTDAAAAGQVALTLNDLECVDISSALTGILAGDLVGVQFNRLATNVLDTIGDVVHYLGIRMRYV